METPSEATIVCTSAAFTFKLNQALADNEAAKGVLSAGAPKVFFKYFYVDSATDEISVPMQTMVKWAQTEADPDPDEP